MHLAPLFSVLSIVSYTLSSPITAAPKAIHLAREPRPTNDGSSSQATVPDVTHPAHTPPSITHVSHSQVSVSVSIPTCTMTSVPDKNGYVPPGTCHAYYDYYPSFNAALAFAILFGILTTLHITQAAFYKKPFCWVICMAVIWEFGSFLTRTLSTRNQQSAGLVLVSQILVLLAPLWVNAFDYMLFARMVHLFLPTRSVFGIRASTFAMIFVGLDIVSFMIQLVGGFMAGPNVPEDQLMKGIHIYMGGIGLQEFFIICFLTLVVRFHTIVGKTRGKAAGAAWNAGGRRLLYTLYASLGLITVCVLPSYLTNKLKAYRLLAKRDKFVLWLTWTCSDSHHLPPC